MKKIITVFAIAVSFCSNAFSQATSLTVDCQTPGWLSSMINYDDQLTLENLEVIGYINSTDLTFIGELIQKSLKSIDLSNVTVTPNNSLTANAFGLNSLCNLKELILPVSLESVESKCLQNVYSETIIVGNTKLHKIQGGLLWKMKNCILREGVDSIVGAFEGITELENIQLPSTLKYIGDSSFRNCKSLERVVFPNSLKEITSVS